MRREIINGLIIGLIVVGGILGLAYYKNMQSQKMSEELARQLSGMTEEQRQALLDKSLESVEDSIKSDCENITKEVNNESECQKLIASLYKDACYYCFAVRDKNVSLCGKISDSNRIKACQEAMGISVGTAESASSSIKVVYPNGGEEWEVGKTYEINRKVALPILLTELYGMSVAE